MLDLFTKKIRSSKNFKSLFREEFFSNPNHQWITSDRYIQANFEEFIDFLSDNMIEKFVKGPGLLFLPSSGKYSCTISSVQDHIIIVFPELMKLLKSSATQHALAILAHELGHIISEHSLRVIDPVEAQVEADLFACKLGFSEQLESFLLDQPESIEKRVRLSFITSYICNKF